MPRLKPTLLTFRGNIAVIQPHRALTLGEMASLRNAMSAVIGSDYRRIILDLAEVDVDPVGLGELIMYFAQARHAGAFIGLMNLTQSVRQLMVITKLATVFPIIQGDVFSRNHELPSGPVVPPSMPPAKRNSNLKRAA